MRLVNADNPIERLPARSREIIGKHHCGTYVELKPIFEDFGIDLRFSEMPQEFSGETSHAPGLSESGFVVRINKQHSRVRQRFTAAHELGHCLLHCDVVRRANDPLLGALYREWEPRYCDLLQDFTADPFTDDSEQEREIEANKFAAALLMPAPILNKLWRGGLRNYRGIAARMGVSPEAVRRRIHELHAASRG